MVSKTKVVNLFGGPGTGKSTVAAHLFAVMKWNYKNVELVDEYAKQLSWEKRYNTLTDQLYVVAQQNYKLHRLNRQVDWIITDSPLIMCLPYADKEYLPNHFKGVVFELFSQYNNINIFLNRVKPFYPIGRHHNEHQSRQLDMDINNILIDNKVSYVSIDADENAAAGIFKYLESLKK